MGVRVGVSTSLGQSDRSTSGALVASGLVSIKCQGDFCRISRSIIPENYCTVLVYSQESLLNFEYLKKKEGSRPTLVSTFDRYWSFQRTEKVDRSELCSRSRQK